MAWISSLGSDVFGGVAVQAITEGRAVVVSASGAHNDLPNISLAPSGATNIYIAMMPPDNFPRPTFESFFLEADTAMIDPRNASSDLTWTEKQYRVGPSLFEQPVIASGWKLQVHKSPVVALTSGDYVDNSNLHTAGALVKVADDGSGKFIYTASSAAAVGVVREYRNGILFVKFADAIK